MSNIQESLHQFLLNQSSVNEISNAFPNRRQQYEYIRLNDMPNALYYMYCITYIDFMLIIIAVFSQVPLSYESSLKLISQISMGISAMLMFYWSCYGIIKKYINIYWGIFWCRYAIGLVIGIYVMQSKRMDVCLWSWVAQSIIIIVAQIIIKRSFVFVWLVLSIDVSLVLILLAVVQKKQDKPIYIEFYVFFYLNIFGFFLALINLCKIRNQWAIMSKLQKLFDIVLMAFIAGLLAYQSFPWPILTIANHLIFGLIWKYFMKNKNSDYKLFKFKYLQQQKSQNLNDKKQKLYQVSLGLLCSQQDYVEPNRQSVIGKPLSQCLCCISQQSTFCYSNCKHVCIGMQCAVKWLQKKVVKCPICRMESGVLIQIKRLNDFQFEVIGKYKLA